MNKQDVIRRILGERGGQPAAEGSAFAPANIALVKYWGKRDEALNLPRTPSLSVSLGELGSRVTIKLNDRADRAALNGHEVDAAGSFSRRLFGFLDLFRPAGAFFDADAVNTIPTAAGLASSASGFAAVVLALDQLFDWKLDRKSLSILARLGSGSACRSLYDGFALWQAGTAPDGMDSYAEPIPETWPALRMGIWLISEKEKAVSSREAMKRTVETSPLYSDWPRKVAVDLAEVEAAIHERDFERLGRTAESNALMMHETMRSARPPINYWTAESEAGIRRVHAVRSEGLPVYFTMDAGPNIKLLFEEKDAGRVKEHFPAVRIVDPWSDRAMEC